MLQRQRDDDDGTSSIDGRGNSSSSITIVSNVNRNGILSVASASPPPSQFRSRSESEPFTRSSGIIGVNRHYHHPHFHEMRYRLFFTTMVLVCVVLQLIWSQYYFSSSSSSSSSSWMEGNLWTDSHRDGGWMQRTETATVRQEGEEVQLPLMPVVQGRLTISTTNGTNLAEEKSDPRSAHSPALPLPTEAHDGTVSQSSGTLVRSLPVNGRARNRTTDETDIGNNIINTMDTINSVVKTTITSNEKSSSRTKPFLYLHIGPHKTGTTTIQNLLALYNEELLQDGVVYLGKINDEMKHKYPLENDIVRPLRSLIDGISGSRQTMLQLKRQLVQCSKRSQHVVMSNEYFSDIYKIRFGLGGRVLEGFHQIMDPFFQVQVVLSYRRYPDWLYSLYNYAVVMDSSSDKWPTNEQNDINDRGKKIHDYRGNNFQVGRTRTPSVREFMAFPSARSRIEQIVKVYASQQDVSSSTSSAGNRWNVDIVDMQNLTYGDVGLDYLCHIIEPAKRACQQYKEDIAKEERTTTHVSNSATGRVTASDHLLAMFVRYDTEIGQNLRIGLRKSKTVELLKSTFDQWTRRNTNTTILELPWEIRSAWKNPNHTINFLNYDGRNNAAVPFSRSQLDLSKLMSSGDLEQWLQMNGGDNVVPLECPIPQEYELIWQILLKEEKLVHEIQWGTGSGSHGQDADGSLRSYFDGFVSSNKLCHLDLDVLYHRNKSWREFMEGELTKITNERR